MKKSKISRILAIIATALTLCAVVCVAVVAATSDPSVIFNGITNKIEYINALPFGNNKPPDLFTNMKDMMPGDSVTEEITVGTKSVGNDKIRIHLRAQNPNEDYVKLVDTYGKWVNFSVKNGKTTITGNLERGVLLGTFKNNEKTTVTVSLTIDKEAGNELENLIAEIDWVFTAEVLDVPFPPFPPRPGGDDKPEPEPEDEDSAELPWLTNDHINYIVGYTDGLVHPEAPVTRAEVATIFYRLLKDNIREAIWSTESVYRDVTVNDWYYVAVCSLTNGGILKGYPDGTFKPNDPITRAEISTIISRFDTIFGTLAASDTFADADGHWAEEYIEFSAARKYVIGYPDGTFKPDQHITRAETVTMVNRCLHRAVDNDGLIAGYISWPDNKSSDWYYYDIIEAANYHNFKRSNRIVKNQTYHYENWSDVLEPIDWAWVEREWVLIYTGE